MPRASYYYAGSLLYKTSGDVISNKSGYALPKQLRFDLYSIVNGFERPEFESRLR